MLTYLIAHAGYIAVTLVLVLIAAAVIAGMVRDRKSGGGCGCGCKGCANAPYCHPQNVRGAHAPGTPNDLSCPK